MCSVFSYSLGLMVHHNHITGQLFEILSRFICLVSFTLISKSCYRAMQYILIIYYTITNLAYIPLFYMIIKTLKENFMTAYRSLRCKIFSVISITFFIFTIRQIFYIKGSLFPSDNF